MVDEPFRGGNYNVENYYTPVNEPYDYNDGIVEPSSKPSMFEALGAGKIFGFTLTFFSVLSIANVIGVEATRNGNSDNTVIAASSSTPELVGQKQEIQMKTSVYMNPNVGLFLA